MIADGGVRRQYIAVAGETASEAVGLGQRHIVTLEMLLQTGQLPERLRTALDHATIRTITYKRRYIRNVNSPFLVEEQEGLAVASIARGDPSTLPGMHRDHNAR